MQETAFHRDMFDGAPFGYALLSMEGELRGANRTFSTMFALKEPCGSWRLQQVLTRGGAIFWETHIIPVLTLRGVVREVALEIDLPEGLRIPVLVNANLQFDSERRSTGIRVALFEAKERRAYERELLQATRNADQIAEVVRRSVDAILSLSPDGVIQSWNNGAEQMFGYSSGDVLGRSFIDLLFPESAHEELRSARQRLERGQEVSTELIGLDSARKELFLSISMTPHMEAPGVLVAFSAIIRDVSVRRLAERALIQSEKLASVGRLASSIAHEINNPLEAVTNLLYILQGQVATPETKALVATAQEELDRVSHIVTHTLRFHKQSTSRTPTHLAPLFESVIALYRARLQNSEVKVDLSRVDSCPLLCYEGELRQILVNLVGNAFDAMRTQGGRLILRGRNATQWRTGEQGIRITVADTGCGISPEVMSHLFEPFFTTKGIAGTGLGLWISRDLVTKNEGTIQMRSRSNAPKTGSVFVLWFRHRDVGSPGARAKG